MGGFMPIADSWVEFAAPVGVFLILMLPFILRILTRHQKEMAEMMRQVHGDPALATEVRELRKQVEDLRTLMLDISLNQPARTPAVQARLSEQETKQT